jgi:hypothetical protein
VRETLEDMAGEEGTKLRVAFPGARTPRDMRMTGNSKPFDGPGPSKVMVELVDMKTGKLEWLPGWYVGARI